MISDAVDVLKLMRERFSDETKWIKGEFAVNANNECVLPGDPNACAWCLTGLVYSLVCSSDLYFVLVEYMCKNLPGISYKRLEVFNDAETTKYSDIMSLIESTIYHLDVELPNEHPDVISFYETQKAQNALK